MRSNRQDAEERQEREREQCSAGVRGCNVHLRSIHSDSRSLAFFGVLRRSWRFHSDDEEQALFTTTVSPEDRKFREGWRLRLCCEPVAQSDDLEAETTPTFGALPYFPIAPATRRAVKRYFKSHGPDWVQRILIVGAPFMLCVVAGVWAGMPREWLSFPAGLGLLGFSVGVVLDRVAARRASLGTIDDVVASELLRSQQMALLRAGIAQVDLRWPHGCGFRNSFMKDNEKTYGGALRSRKVGKDYKLRWTPQEYTRVNFGHEHLFVYQVAIDLTTGLALEEVTREFAYRDIVTVVTSGERTTLHLRTHRALAKAKKYWLPRGATVSGTALIRDGEQTVSLRLRSGEDVLLARWVGAQGAIQPDEVRVNTEATARLMGYLRELRQQPARVQVAPRIVRH
jgi:hypothetical protein